jgi:mannan endo-1,4-beta-mannosidase
VRIPGKAVAIAVPLAILAAASWAVIGSQGVASLPVPGSPAVSRPAPPARYVGVSVPSPMAANLDAFARGTGANPGIVAYYERFGSSFRDSPVGASLTAIASGGYDGYLRSYALSVRTFRARIIISFGHEMNGPWWPWGKGHESPASFIAAWRHVHDVFAQAGATNVTWLWNPNVVSGPSVANPAAWWPGGAYVDWIGLDGYYWHPADTFASVFSGALAQMRALSPGKPVIIAETGAYPGPKMAARIGQLFAGATAAGVTAVVYFDHDGHADWRLEDHPAALAAFRAGIRGFG